MLNTNMNRRSERQFALRVVVLILEDQERILQGKVDKWELEPLLLTSVQTAFKDISEKRKKYAFMVQLEESLHTLASQDVERLLSLAAGYDMDAARRHTEIRSLVATGQIGEKSATKLHLWNL